jgi:glycosyltransferase involved in cell wall biosynthesis
MRTYVLVSGDFTPWGGMDRANYELAWYLADQLGAAVHLVSHRVAPLLAEHPGVTWHRVAKPLQSYLLAGPLLARAGYAIARRMAGQGARVIVNGGNCPWGDVNWVHAVHAAWNNRDLHAPPLFRLRNYWSKRRARCAEMRAVRAARLVITNSALARQQVIDHLGAAADRVHAVYLGTDAGVFRPYSDQERVALRQRLGWTVDQPSVMFIGSLGRDRNKGFDVAVDAWQQLCNRPEWTAQLVAAGAGYEVELWRRRVAVLGLNDRIRLVGFTPQILQMLAAADALVSPTHYDAYGLSVHEALCCGLPAFVTRSAGIAERYPADLSDLLLSDPPDATDLAARLQAWSQEPDAYRSRIRPFSEALRQRSWADMGRDMLELMERVA